LDSFNWSALLSKDRRDVAASKAATVSAIRLLDVLPERPVVTLPQAMELLEVSKPTAIKAIDALTKAGILKETTGLQRDRVYAYDGLESKFPSRCNVGC